MAMLSQGLRLTVKKLLVLRLLKVHAKGLAHVATTLERNHILELAVKGLLSVTTMHNVLAMRLFDMVIFINVIGVFGLASELTGRRVAFRLTEEVVKSVVTREALVLRLVTMDALLIVVRIITPIFALPLVLRLGLVATVFALPLLLGLVGTILMVFSWVKLEVSRDHRVEHGKLLVHEMRCGHLLHKDRFVDEHRGVAIDERLEDAVVVGEEGDFSVNNLLGLCGHVHTVHGHIVVECFNKLRVASCVNLFLTDT
jgi:hypothetical protein